MAGTVIQEQMTVGMGNGLGYPDPFDDVAGRSVPASFRGLLYWAENVYNRYGTYRMAMQRVISYFLTDIQIFAEGEDESEKWKKFHKEVLQTLPQLTAGCHDRAAYGNAFFTVHAPIVRWLRCPHCGYTAPFREIHENKAFNFSFSLPEFLAKCPGTKGEHPCGYEGKWKVEDREDDEETKIKLIRWSPHEIEILQCPYTKDVTYLWRIPEDYKQQVRSGHPFILERVSKTILKAIASNQLYQFGPGVVFHMRDLPLAGVKDRGWGFPPVLMNFSQMYYVNSLRRSNEAIALEYVTPFRVITPAAAQGKSMGGMSTDPLLAHNGGDFRAQVMRMIRNRRRDPGSIQTMATPLNYQMFGADANQIAPAELLDQGIKTLLNDLGVPLELFTGTLQLQTAPVALRLFESTWRQLVADCNSFLLWLQEQCAQILGWETVGAQLQRVTVADNIEQRMLEAQLMMQQQISGTTVLRDMGRDFKQEQKQIAEDARFQAETQARTQEEMQQSGFAQSIAKGQQPGGDPSQQGAQQGGAQGGDPSMAPPQGPVSSYLSTLSPNVPQTPESMQQVAEGLAQELLGQPESVKDSELRKLSTQNKVLHSLVKSRMEQIREETKSRAGNAAMGQFQQAG